MHYIYHDSAEAWCLGLQNNENRYMVAISVKKYILCFIVSCGLLCWLCHHSMKGGEGVGVAQRAMIRVLG